MESLKPLANDKSRIFVIDALRGIAIFGILLVNGPSLNGPAIKDTVSFAFQTSFLDVIYTKLVFFLAVEKFYPIFAILFGVSAAIFMRGKPINLWFKRLCVLFSLGCLHASLVWWGDILVVYSLLGLLLAPLAACSEKTIKYICFSLIAVGIALSLIQSFLPAYEELLVGSNPLVYQEGGFLAITKQRLFDFYGVYVPGVFYTLSPGQVVNFTLYFLELFTLFVGGFYLYRSGILLKLTSDKILARRLVLSLFCISAVLWFAAKIIDYENLELWQTLSQGLFYAASVVYLSHFPACGRLLQRFAYVGQMSLSNYLLHTSLLSIIFYGYGFGLYGHIGPFGQAPILFLLMTISLLVSKLWLSHFRYGPVEWLWHQITYGGKSQKAMPVEALNDLKNFFSESHHNFDKDKNNNDPLQT